MEQIDFLEFQAYCDKYGHPDTHHRCPTCGLQVNKLHREWFPHHYQEVGEEDGEKATQDD